MPRTIVEESPFYPLHVGRNQPIASPFWDAVRHNEKQLDPEELKKVFRIRGEEPPKRDAGPAKKEYHGTQSSSHRHEVTDDILFKSGIEVKDLLASLDAMSLDYLQSKLTFPYTFYESMRGWLDDPYFAELKLAPEIERHSYDHLILEILDHPNVANIVEFLFKINDIEADVAEFEEFVARVGAAFVLVSDKCAGFDRFLEILLAHVNFFRVNANVQPHLGLTLTSGSLYSFFFSHKQEGQHMSSYLYNFCQADPVAKDWHQTYESLSKLTYNTVSGAMEKVSGTNSSLSSLKQVLETLTHEASKKRVEACVAKLDAAVQQLKNHVAKFTQSLREKYNIKSDFESWGLLEVNHLRGCTANWTTHPDLISTAVYEGLATLLFFSLFRSFWAELAHESVQASTAKAPAAEPTHTSEGAATPEGAVTPEEQLHDTLDSYDRYKIFLKSLLAKFDQGLLGEDDLCEELEAVLVPCLVKKRAIVKEVTAGKV